MKFEMSTETVTVTTASALLRLAEMDYAAALDYRREARDAYLSGEGSLNEMLGAESQLASYLEKYETVRNDPYALKGMVNHYGC